MAKIKVNENINDGVKYYHTQYIYFCPGCKEEHAVGLKSEGGHHDFNMNLDKPTFSPSCLHNFMPNRICHSFIKDGIISFLGDCWHDLKGKTIELPEIE
jgi:hypothetical protein